MSPKTPQAKLTPPMVALFAFACGVIVANLYYSQPLPRLVFVLMS